MSGIPPPGKQPDKQAHTACKQPALSDLCAEDQTSFLFRLKTVNTKCKHTHTRCVFIASVRPLKIKYKSESIFFSTAKYREDFKLVIDRIAVVKSENVSEGFYLFRKRFPSDSLVICLFLQNSLYHCYRLKRPQLHLKIRTQLNYSAWIPSRK